MDINEIERIAELEIRLSFQDEALNTLNEVVIAQGLQILQLQRQLAELRESLSGNAHDPVNVPLLDERPPHY